MRFKYLNELADIVVRIDEDKNISDSNVVSVTDRGIRLIANMKQLGISVGALQETFAGMQLMCDNRVVLAELIDMAHEEISRLLGKDAWRVYGCDEGGWFYQTCDSCDRAAA
jgi:hypothetical protein